jgi:hypothetical protein
MIVRIFQGAWLAAALLLCSVACAQTATTPDPFKVQMGLCAAITAGDAEAVAAALDKGAHLDRDCPEEMAAPILHAVAIGNTAVVTLLLDRGANVNQEDNGVGATPMHYAAVNKDAAMVTLLAKRGGKVNALTTDGLSPLALAVSEADDTAVAQALIGAGADVNAADEQGDTILDWAVAKGHKLVAKLLEEKGAKRGEEAPAPSSVTVPAPMPQATGGGAPSGKRTPDGKLIFKGLYLGMPVLEAIEVFRKLDMPPKTDKDFIVLGPQADARGIAKQEDGTLVARAQLVSGLNAWIVRAHPDGRVKQILLRSDVVFRLFAVAPNTLLSEFGTGFFDAYGLRDGAQLVPMTTASEVRTKLEGPEVCQAMQFTDAANGWFLTMNDYADINYAEPGTKPAVKFD